MRYAEVGFKKRKLMDMEMPYAVQRVGLDGADYVVTSPEAPGAVYLLRPPNWDATVLTDGPGGTMSIIGMDSSRILAIMGCFPGYRFHDAGIYLIERDARPVCSTWSRAKIVELPFAHRLEHIHHRGRQWLVAASLARSKDDPADWSRPGTLCVGPIPGDGTHGWGMKPILSDLHKNHGMFKGTLDRRDVLIVSGTEGAYLFDTSDDNDDPWKHIKLLDHGISEICTIDLDDDGREELVTVEPFHGNLMRVFKRSGGRSFQVCGERELAFGHGLWCGRLNGVPSILVGNRAGDGALKLYRPVDGNPANLAETIVDAGVGPANIAVVPGTSGDLLFSTNQSSKEVALYESVLA